MTEKLDEEKEITHVAIVHSETTSGILNDIESVAKVVKERNKVFIVDAMSSFGGVDIEVGKLGIDFIISSANKCIQGVPGFSFVIANKNLLLASRGKARSLSLIYMINGKLWIKTESGDLLLQLIRFWHLQKQWKS